MDVFSGSLSGREGCLRESTDAEAQGVPELFSETARPLMRQPICRVWWNIYHDSGVPARSLGCGADTPAAVLDQAVFIGCISCCRPRDGQSQVPQFHPQGLARDSQ